MFCPLVGTFPLMMSALLGAETVFHEGHKPYVVRTMYLDVALLLQVCLMRPCCYWMKWMEVRRVLEEAQWPFRTKVV